MKGFIKKQVDKIILYALCIIILFLIGVIFKMQISILISTLSFITSIFAIILEKTWLEDYKNELNCKLETHRAKLSGYTLVTKLQYDLEFKIYTEISEKIFLLYIETEKITDNLSFYNVIKERIDSFSNIYNTTSNLINMNRAFYSKEIYNLLIETRNICLKEAQEVEKSALVNINNFNLQFSEDRREKIKEKLDEISDLIRERIENMKIVE